MSLPDELPEFTLGWGVLQWCTVWLNQPDETPNKLQYETWEFTDEQAEFILHFYAVDDQGRRLYDRAVLERPKGWGKSPLLAALCAAELLGPVKFSHFSKGYAVGKPRMDAIVQIAAISESQTKNTFNLIREMLVGKAERHFGLSLMLTQISAPGGRLIERITASPKSIEGNRSTFACLDETHLWTPIERGDMLAETVRRNLAKKNGISIETTNAPVPGQMSVAEVSHDYYEQIVQGLITEHKLLFDTREVVVEDIYDKDQAFPALVEVYGDAADPDTGWIDLDRIWREINDPATREYNARRFYFNQRVQEEGKWIKDTQWAKAKNESLRLKKSDICTLGFQGVTRNGAAAIVAFRPRDGALFLVKFWEKPSNLAQHVVWELPVALVDAKMRKLLANDNNRYLMAAPQTLQDVVGRWSVDFEDKVEEFWLNQKLKQAKAVDQLESAILSEPPRVWHNGDKDFTRHISQTHTTEETHGFTLRKETPHSNKYIAAAYAACLAVEAAGVAAEKGLLDLPADNTIYGF